MMTQGVSTAWKRRVLREGGENLNVLSQMAPAVRGTEEVNVFKYSTADEVTRRIFPFLNS
jgi:hypothetical protein